MTAPLSPLYADSATPVPEARQAAERAFMRVAEQLPQIMDLAADDAVLLADFTMVYGTEPDPLDPDAVERREEALARLAEQFQANDALVVRKLERYIHVLETQTMLADSFKARAKRLRDHAASIERGQDALKQRLLQAMKVMERESVATPSGVVSIRSNPPHVDVLEAMLVPSEYQRTVITTSVDKTAILKDFKATGAIPPGVDVSRTESLRIA